MMQTEASLTPDNQFFLQAYLLSQKVEGEQHISRRQCGLNSIVTSFGSLSCLICGKEADPQRSLSTSAAELNLLS